MRTEVMGRRLPDTPQNELPLQYDEVREGDIWKLLDIDTGQPIVVTDRPSNLTGAHWMAMTPGRWLANLKAHTVREHDDGTVSVLPGDGSSNSILVRGSATDPSRAWHGYIYHNLWRSV